MLNIIINSFFNTKKFFFYLSLLNYSVKLENCIVCNNGKILEKCHLINCEVAANFVVSKNSKC